jgi:hypothetical protein
MATQRLAEEQKKAADNVLGRLDKCAADIIANHAAWGLDQETAKGLVNHLDRVADNLETSVYGERSLRARQVEVLKKAKVFQQDADEPYMKQFQVDQGVVQQDADEPYMSAYSDDQSSAVREGVSTSGRPLTGG